jgi:DNA-directed RNA polymerase subunit RPC12/RpoP
MYSAWAEADSLRGLSVDALMRDEFQDWSASAIANTAASTSRSKFAVEFSFGTPKTSGSPFNKIWELSDQRYFHPRCVKCSKLFMITLDNLVHSDIVKCPHCGFEQRKRDCNLRGEWIPTRSTGPEGRVGFHISQLIHPEITKEAILRFKQENSDSKFKNEVLGEFSTVGARPLEERDMIDRCCTPYKDIPFPYLVQAPNETFMGIDWGGRNEVNNRGAYTVVTIIGKNRDKYEVKHTEMLTSVEYLKQVARIRELITLYNCVSIVADSGYGQVQCQMLQSEYGPKVKSAYYAPNSKNKMSYNEETWMLTIDRNAFIEELIDIINRGQLVIPWKNPVEWFVQQVCNVEIKINQKTGNVFKSYEKVNTAEPNDAMHSLNYAYIASIVHLGLGNLGRTPTTSKNQQTIAGSMVGANFNGRPGKFDKRSMPLFTRNGITGR